MSSSPVTSSSSLLSIDRGRSVRKATAEIVIMLVLVWYIFFNMDFSVVNGLPPLLSILCKRLTAVFRDVCRLGVVWLHICIAAVVHNEDASLWLIIHIMQPFVICCHSFGLYVQSDGVRKPLERLLRWTCQPVSRLQPLPHICACWDVVINRHVMLKHLPVKMTMREIEWSNIICIFTRPMYTLPGHDVRVFAPRNVQESNVDSNDNSSNHLVYVNTFKCCSVPSNIWLA